MQPMKPMEPLKPMAPMEPMTPMAPIDFGPAWWPEALGQPASSGAQDGLRYAFFPKARRLLVEQEGRVTTYDSGDHRIGGVSQQSAERSPAFTSQHGAVDLRELPVVG